MKKTKLHSIGLQGREHERGAALITMLLVSTLILAAGGALIVSTSTSAVNAIDAAAEKQAYYAAETGLQMALNVLRGNMPPSPALAGNEKISMLAAVTVSKSNAVQSGDTSTTPRLSRWLPYSSMAANSRVTLANGTSYSVAITDPDGNAAGTSPTRLLITSTGYGPKNSLRRLQAVVQAGAFDFDPPGAVTGIPSDKGDDMDFRVDDGHSGGGCSDPRLAKAYSGIDAANPLNIKPAFAVGAGDLPGVTTDLANLIDYSACPSTPNLNSISPNTPANPAAQSLNNLVYPDVLKSATVANEFLNSLRDLAKAQGRYFSDNKDGDIASLGTDASGQPYGNGYITFVENDLTIENHSSGAGILVVTGEFRPRQNFDFKGLILVMGKNARVRFDDHGDNNRPTENFSGAIVVADFDPSKLSDGFGKAEFRDEDPDVKSTVQYDSSWIIRAMGLTGFRTMGVLEN
jgi:hypothetical protein